MKCQILISRENKKKYFKMMSAEIFNQHAVFMVSIMGNNFSRLHFDSISYFAPENRIFHISCKLSPQGTPCMKCQIIFS